MNPTPSVPARVREDVAACLAEIEALLQHFSAPSREAVAKALKVIDSHI